MEQDKKERLLTAAMKMFAERGFENVSIRQIANEADLNSAMISYYFGGKEQLFTAVLSRQAKPLVDFSRQDTSHLSTEEVLSKYITIMKEIHHEHPSLGEFIVQSFTCKTPLYAGFAKKMENVFRLLSQALQRGIAEGKLRKDLDVKEATILLVGMANFHFLTQNFRKQFPIADGQNEDVYMKQALQIFLAGIAKKA